MLASKKGARVAPPRNFRAAGAIEWVRHSAFPPPFLRRKRSRGRRRQGERYEEKAQAYMLERFGSFYVPSPWFVFKPVGVEKPRWCQPDGLLFFPLAGDITIVEMKLQHTADAWWQVKWLYHPVVAQAFPPDLWTYSFVEMVRWYDKDTTFPERFQMLPDVTSAEVNRFGVHIWRG